MQSPKGTYNRKGKRAGQVRGFCNEHSFNIARGLIDLLGPRRLFLTNFRAMNRLTLEPYVTKGTDALLRVWGSAASFVFRGVRQDLDIPD